MSNEIEAGGLWGLARSLRGGKKNKPKFDSCQNCDTKLNGRYCHECGQLADDFQRPIWSLVAEGISDLFALDGRLWRTIPTLLFRPGRITRQYIDGKRATQVPPFRLYLIASVLFFTTLFLFGPSGDDVEKLFSMTPNASSEACETGREAAEGDAEALAKIEEMCDKSTPQSVEQEEPIIGEIDLGEGLEGVSKIITENGNILLKEPQRFWLLVQSWAPRIAFLLLPFLVVGLAVLYPFKRNVYVYDHVVLSLHFLTMLFVLWIISFSLPSGLTGLLLTFYPFYYMYRSLRVVFESGRILAFLRASILWGSSFLVVIFLGVVTLATVTIAA